jgi:serine O-acetyltransferase
MYHLTEWGVASLVSQLREIRIHSLETRKRLHKPPRLPSRKTLARILEDLSGALFPNRLGRADLREEVIDYYVGNTLDNALRGLYEQINRELQFMAEKNTYLSDYDAKTIVRKFAEQLPHIRQLLDSDIQAAYSGDPAARTPDEALVCYPGIYAMIHQRLAHLLYQLGVPLTARMITELAHSATGIDIHPGATIGKRFFIDHGTGVVIGETTVIGNGVRLYQAVTLGAKRFEENPDGSLVKGNARHPIVEDDVVIYAGATILGRIVIGRGTVIGGNVWLTQSVPPKSVITQALLRQE